MSDLEKFVGLLDEAGYKCVEENDPAKMGPKEYAIEELEFVDHVYLGVVRGSLRFAFTKKGGLLGHAVGS